MPFGVLASLQRRSRQLETLRKMLAGVDQLIGLAEKLSKERDLTPDESLELAALEHRRERIAKSLAEAGG